MSKVRWNGGMHGQFMCAGPTKGLSGCLGGGKEADGFRGIP